MAKFYDAINDAHRNFIAAQHMFFVSTAPPVADGHINLSPKGLDSFRVLSSNRVGYMDLIGSGNETSAHLLAGSPITFMFCAFEDPPNILRLYGTGTTILPGDAEWNALQAEFTVYPSTRQLIIAEITLVQTSCGFGVPRYEYLGERDMHFAWAEKKGEDGLKLYQQEKNAASLDGLPSALKFRNGG
jgi:hypothetical protein